MSSFAYNRRIVSDWLEKDHIVKFVGVIEDQSLLVMKYLPLGNLWDQHEKSPITEEEAVFLLYQGLEALEHVHGQGVTHRDIAPGNILVQSREPFMIKLADFGLAKEGVMQSCCGTYCYTAREVFLGGPYEYKADIWSLGVITMEFVYGLPEPRPRQVTDKWRKKIIRKAAQWDEEGSEDPLMAVLAQKMLKLDVKDRATAEECLTFGWHKNDKKKKKGIFAMVIETDHAGSAQGIDVASISTEGSSRRPEDYDVSLRSYHVASEVTEFTRSRRSGREAVHFYNEAPGASIDQNPQECIQSSNSLPEEVPAALPSKRRRQQIAGSSSSASESQTKRARADISHEASTQLPEPFTGRIPQQEAEQIQRSDIRHHKTDGQASRLPEQMPLSNRNIQDNVRTLLAENLNDGNKEEVEVRRSR